MDRYGYIGIETLLNFCENSKDHAVTPNDFMRMDRVRVPERELMAEYHVGEYIIYRNGEKYEIGRITSIRDDGAFVCYYEGETAAKTPYSHMHKLINAYVIKNTTLGGGRFEERGYDD